MNAYDDNDDDNDVNVDSASRRSALSTTFKSLLGPLALSLLSTSNNMSASMGIGIQMANAAVGTLPEYADSNAVLQGITIDVADTEQQKDMISFLEDGFSFKKLRQSKRGSVTDTWMTFGPEQMSIPPQWEPAVSSMESYGGHASIHIRYDSQGTDVYFRKGPDAEAPGNNIAYLQVGVPSYRISQMVKTGGNVYNGYGIVEVVSPSGLPMRGIVGISPDPMMFVALNCANVKESKEFYQQLGFREEEYPYCRPNKGMGQFEPVQPKGSVYLSPGKNSMGVLLLQAERKRGKANVRPNPVVRSLNVVFQPSDGTVVDASSADLMKVVDPSFVPISFEPIDLFSKKEEASRIPLLSQEAISLPTFEDKA